VGRELERPWQREQPAPEEPARQLGQPGAEVPRDQREPEYEPILHSALPVIDISATSQDAHTSRKLLLILVFRRTSMT
jgi:hypothetical protein